MSPFDEIVSKVLQSCRERSWLVATAESCTAGMVSAALTEIAGSSDVFERGFVTYSNSAKQEMLGVSGKTLDSFGAVSEEVAQEMATGALQHSDADLSVSITGIAGPGGSDHKPEGRVCFGIAHRDGDCQTETIEFGAMGRDNVRAAACKHALGLLAQASTSRFA
ncbi:MAG: CinA family protein [Rhodobacteraceae bacterium]|nr:CinA family protein [Paracoccaceae bacterium]